MSHLWQWAGHRWHSIYSIYVQAHLATCITVQVQGQLGSAVVDDPVGQMPFSSLFEHVGDVSVAKYTTKSVVPSHPVRRLNRDLPSWASMLSQVKIPWLGPLLMQMGVSSKDRLLATAFDKIHMTGEDMIQRIVLLRCCATK